MPEAAEARSVDARDGDLRRFEPRGADVRSFEVRHDEPRPYEGRDAEVRAFEPRRSDTRTFATRPFEESFDDRVADANVVSRYPVDVVAPSEESFFDQDLS